MRISQLQEPYKKLAQFYTLETKKKKRGLTLGNAFNWGTCVNFNYTKLHWKFWSDVEDGKSPKIPESILSHFNKHNPKQAFTVMGMPKPVSVKKEKAVEPSTDDNQHLIGRKISAFAFKSGTNGIHYDPETNDYVLGYDGTIIAAYPDAIQVSFETKKGTITVYYPFGKDVKSDLSGRSAESFLIPEEEVQKILDNMPAEPFKVGETVYLRGNGGQYKCVIDRIYFSGNCPISLDAGKRTVLQDVRIDGRRSPKGDVILSHTPWLNENGVPLEILNPEPEEQRDYKEELRSAEETIANLDRMCSALREDKEYWFDIADQAHKNEEAMLKELNLNLDRAVFHCVKVEETSGSITLDDVTYCLHLIKRVMHHQFAYKPKQEEV